MERFEWTLIANGYSNVTGGSWGVGKGHLTANKAKVECFKRSI